MTTKSYVICTNLPPTFKGNNFFYKLLKQQVSGGLLGALIEDNSTVGLAIFDTVQSALAACKEHIQFKGTKNADGSTDVFEAKLRIVETDNPTRAAESVYVDTITVEGQVVKKEDIDFTYGLQLILRGEQGATWCHHTRNKEPCPLSVKCKFIHLREHQQAIKKRLRTEVMGAGGAAEEELDKNVAAGAVSGMPFLAPQLASVVVTPQMAEGLLQGDEAVMAQLAARLFSGEGGAASGATSSTAAAAADLARAVLRVESQLGGTTAMDYYTTTTTSANNNNNEGGIDYLKTAAKCVLPPNGCPTPAERDAFIREILKKRNLADAILSSSSSAASSSSSSSAAVDRIKHFVTASPNIRRQLANVSAMPLRITLQPRYVIAAPAVQELTFFMKDGIVTCITQHYDDVLAPRNLFESETSNELGEGMAFILDKVREVRGKLEQWASAKKRQSGGQTFSAAIHVAFPSAVYSTSSSGGGDAPAAADSTAAGTVPYPTAESIAVTPSSLLFNEEVITPAHFAGTPVVLGVKVFEGAAAQSLLFSPTASHDTMSSARPLWRRLRTAPTPMFQRSVIDKFAVWDE